jgi:hypothetical protein
MNIRMRLRLGSSTIVTLLLSAFVITTGALASTACDGSTEPTEGGSNGTPAPQDEAGTTGDPGCKTRFPVSQPLSAPCCAEWAIDACGAGLFCAALDGRTQATCYSERSRRDGETCLTDNHCLSEHCDSITKTCRLRPGASCNAGDTCARDKNGLRHECVESRCTPTPCDPIVQTSCLAWETCDVVGDTTGCRDVGAGKRGEPCVLGTCARGLTCSPEGRCRGICRTDAACSKGTSCRGVSSLFGYCPL